GHTGGLAELARAGTTGPLRQSAEQTGWIVQRLQGYPSAEGPIEVLPRTGDLGPCILGGLLVSSALLHLRKTEGGENIVINGLSPSLVEGDLVDLDLTNPVSLSSQANP